MTDNRRVSWKYFKLDNKRRDKRKLTLPQFARNALRTAWSQCFPKRVGKERPQTNVFHKKIHLHTKNSANTSELLAVTVTTAQGNLRLSMQAWRHNNLPNQTFILNSCAFLSSKSPKQLFLMSSYPSQQRTGCQSIGARNSIHQSRNEPCSTTHMKLFNFQGRNDNRKG